MSQGLADTSVFIARELGRPINLAALPDDLSVSMITIGELRAGALVASDVDMRERRFATLLAALSLDPVPIDHEVAQAWARLRVRLRDAGKRMPVNDSWIAATAIALGLPVVSQDADYDVSVEGLEVIHV
ncbi:MAG TPA: type II toxin-antitoxin system VapC family toxin [Chloroflexota bacterium]